MVWAKNKKYLIFIVAVAAILRIYGLTFNPPSLFGDELDVGYHAYSISKTGKDYYGNFLPFHFHSLAEWRTPLYLYSAVPTVAIFGISPLGVRLPAALFGVFGIIGIYYFVKKAFDDEKYALLASIFFALNPWHLQYSRAAFEVTMLLAFYIFGIYFFLLALEKKGKWLWLATALFIFTPWIYSSAKLFTPLLLIIILFNWKGEIFKFKRREIFRALASGAIVGLPIVYSIFFGGGSQRFGYIGVFTDPTMQTEVGAARQLAASRRGATGVGISPNVVERAMHNKFTFWGETIISNYIHAFSFDFLFINGDPNPRHSLNDIGMFYRADVIALIFGIVSFVMINQSAGRKKWRNFILVWLIIAPIPAAITRDGGNHATRLILMLIPVATIISYGIYYMFKNKKLIFVFYLGLLLISFIFYQWKYWVVYPWSSERWWHSGYQEAIQSIKPIENEYDNIVISTANEPPWIFFAAWYEYDPDSWHKNFPIGNDVFLEGFGDISHIDKFYFGSPQVGGVYDWGQVINDRTLYVASAKEVNVNLIREPERTPNDLLLLKAIAYPSGEPAFYLFSGKGE